MTTNHSTNPNLAPYQCVVASQHLVDPVDMFVIMPGDTGTILATHDNGDVEARFYGHDCLIEADDAATLKPRPPKLLRRLMLLSVAILGLSCVSAPVSAVAQQQSDVPPPVATAPHYDHKMEARYQISEAIEAASRAYADSLACGYQTDLSAIADGLRKMNLSTGNEADMITMAIPAGVANIIDAANHKPDCTAVWRAYGPNGTDPMFAGLISPNDDGN